MPGRLLDSPAWGVGATGGILASGILVVTVWLSMSASAMAHANASSLLTGPADDAGHAAAAVLRASNNSPVLLAVGASSMREAFPDEAIVTRALSAAAAGQMRFVLVATSGETLLESMGIIASYPLPRGSVVLLQIDPRRLRVSDANVHAFRTQDRIPFLDEKRVNLWLAESGVAARAGWAPVRRRLWFSALLRGRLLPLQMRCGRSARRGKFASGCVGALLSGPWIAPFPTYDAHNYSDVSLPEPTKDSLAALEWARGLMSTPATMSIGSAILKTSARRIAASNSRLVLTILPADSRVLRAEVVDERELLAAIAPARAVGASLLDLRRSLSLPDTSFYDLHHVRPAVRGAIVSAVAGGVVAPVPD